MEPGQTLKKPLRYDNHAFAFSSPYEALGRSRRCTCYSVSTPGNEYLGQSKVPSRSRLRQNKDMLQLNAKFNFVKRASNSTDHPSLSIEPAIVPVHHYHREM